jgi:hypothetical protein
MDYKIGNYNLIISGNILEVYRYAFPYIKENHKEKGGRHEGKIDDKRLEEYAIQSIGQTRNNMRRLINANFKEGDIFTTLTFENFVGIDDIKYASNEYNKFTKRFTRFAKNNDIELKIITAIELTKKKCIHYHFIANVPIEIFEGKSRFEKEELFQKKIWQHGFVEIKKIKSNIKSIDNVGAYLIKYLMKGERLGKNIHQCFHSRNLIKPIKVSTNDNIDVLKQYDIGEYPIDVKEIITELFNHVPRYTNEYLGEYQGKIEYWEWNTKENAFKINIKEKLMEVHK